MQGPQTTRSNRERSGATRDTLIAVARALFVEKGYAETSTPEIAAAAAVTRGALYHHFEDKRDLFRAVLDREARAVVNEIETVAPSTLSARAALMVGSEAYLNAMSVAGRTRLLLVEGPAVLGSAEMNALEEANAIRTLRDGLRAAMAETGETALSPSVLAVLLSAAFDRAATAIEAGADATAFKSAMVGLIERVLK